MISTPPRERVVLVGLGAMGLPILRRLNSAGIPTFGIDSDPSRLAIAQEEGIPCSNSLTDAPESSIVVTLVAGAEQCMQVVHGFKVNIDWTPRVWTVMSTLGVSQIRAIANELVSPDTDLIDAPVTGGVAGASSGDLQIMCAGNQSTYDFLEPLFGHLGTSRRISSRIGDAQALKLVNNLLTTIHLVAGAEALALAEALELDPSILREILLGGSASSWMLQDRFPRYIDRDAQENAVTALRIFVKDSQLIRSMADAAQRPVPLLESAERILERAQSMGLADWDDSSVIRVYD